MVKTINALFQIGGGAVNVRHEKIADQSVNRIAMADIQRIRGCLWQLLQGKASGQGCSCLGRVLKRMEHHSWRLSCIDNFERTIQTTTKCAVCLRSIRRHTADNRVYCNGWQSVFVHHINNCLLEFYSYILCAVTTERGCYSC